MAMPLTVKEFERFRAKCKHQAPHRTDGKGRSWCLRCGEQVLRALATAHNSKLGGTFP